MPQTICFASARGHWRTPNAPASESRQLHRTVGSAWQSWQVRSAPFVTTPATTVVSPDRVQEAEQLDDATVVSPDWTSGAIKDMSPDQFHRFSNSVTMYHVTFCPHDLLFLPAGWLCSEFGYKVSMIPSQASVQEAFPRMRDGL